MHLHHGDAEAFYDAGVVCARAGDFKGAIKNFEQAVAVHPEHGLWHHSLGVALGMAGCWAEAANAFETSLRFNSENPDTLASHALALFKCGLFEEAAAIGQRALAIIPDSPFLLRTLGEVYAALGLRDEAAGSFARCVHLDSGNPRNLEAAAKFSSACGEESLAVELFAKLCEVLHKSAGAWAKLGGAQISAGHLEGALHALRTAVTLEPSSHRLQSILLYTSVMDPSQSGEQLLAAHKQWRSNQTHPRKPGEFPNLRDPERRLRIGFLTGEFGDGSISYFLPPILRGFDGAEFEIAAYSAATEDARCRYGRFFEIWRNVADLSDERVEAIVREDGIDILLDVSGHLPGHRLGVFVRRAAPVQVAYPRYPCTTGVNAMDYRITDVWADPPGLTEQHYCEKLLRIPSGYLAYEPPKGAPAVGELPALRNGFITFGFFQTPLKLNDGVLNALAETLLAVPKSRLLFHHAVNDFGRRERWARQWIEKEMDVRGINPDRLSFCGPLNSSDHLALLSEVDIALDSFPSSGQTNTGECLWMGVPVITLAGDRFAGRVSAAVLYRSGLSGWVARDEWAYVENAAELCSDLDILADIRKDLRGKLAAGEYSLVGNDRVSRDIGKALRTAWRTWCNSGE